MIPRSNNMKNLQYLEKQFPAMLLNLVFAQGDKGIADKTASMRKVFVRLVDKALDEYSSSFQCMQEQINHIESRTNNPGAGAELYMFKFIDHMENCISSIRRSLRYLDYLIGNSDGLLVDRTIRRSIDAYKTDLIDIRNSIEHLDNDIHKGEILNKKTVMIKISTDEKGIILGDISLSFSSLSAILKNLNELSMSFAQYRKNA